MIRACYITIMLVCFYAAIGTIVYLMFVSFWHTVAVMCCMLGLYCSVEMCRAVR